MDAYGHVELGGFVDLLPMVLGAVHEEPTDDALADVGVLVILEDGQLGVRYIDLDTFQQSSQLLLDLPRTTE